MDISMTARIPRLVIAGLSGDSGKTIVSLSLITAMLKREMIVAPFKKGPDYIDSAWLGYLAGRQCRNLDCFIVDDKIVKHNFIVNANQSDMAIIEGNRGIYDGLDESGQVSTAELAKLLQAPVVLVVNAAKTTRTLAVIIKGINDFDNDLNIVGIVLNKVAGKRHEATIRKSLEKYCDIPVVGVLPKLGKDAELIPDRHLGLVTPSEYSQYDKLTDKLNEIADRYLDVDKLIGFAGNAPELEIPNKATIPTIQDQAIKIGYFKDSVFTFYYPENLEALERNGAELVAISSLTDSSLPDDIDGLYIGGGFPETQADKLSRNRSLMIDLKNRIDLGLPVYAECGGLIYLSESILWDGQEFNMAGVFPMKLKMNKKPAGHGYTICKVDKENPFFGLGDEIKGHEFHYSSPIDGQPELESCLAVVKGKGVSNKRDGLVYKNCFAGYVHIHADGNINWAKAFVKEAIEFKKEKTGGNFRIAG